MKLSRHLTPLIALAFSVLSMNALAEMPAKSPSDASVVLDGKHAATVLKQCSRPTPTPLTGTWQPTQTDIDALESRLPQLQKLTATGCYLEGGRVSDVTAYGRQYVGVIIGKRKLIYINAFRAEGHRVDKERWRNEPVIVCDGGNSFWGAVYDPETGTFSELAFNGVA